MPATVQCLAYTFDAAGDLKTANDNVDATRNQAFNYDALYRLTQASGVYGTYGYGYGYDADNNRTSISLSSPGNSYSATYAYAATSNQLLSVTQGTTVRTISYTADGNTLQDNSGTGVVLSYGYNNDNRMVQASLGGATQASYTLNYLGQRVIKSALTSGTTHFHYDRGGHLIAESDGTGAVQREYIYLGDTPVAFITPTGGIDIIHTDHLGTPQKLTDATQAVVWDGGASDPFMMGALPTTPAMNQRFPGQYFDGETGLHYNYFRDYDPSLGRYVESDPIGLGGGINTFAYVGGNPVNGVDPFGLRTVNIGISGSINIPLYGAVGVGGGGSAGIAFDGSQFAWYYVAGGGVGGGAGASLGIQIGGSDADSVCDLRGPFGSLSASAGEGLIAGGEGYTGSGSHGQTVTGGNFFFGGGGGTLASGTAGTTYTWVSPW